MAAIACLCRGRHYLVLDHRSDTFRPGHQEASGGYYLHTLGALGGRDCRDKGKALSAYENAPETGNIHVWFDVG